MAKPVQWLCLFVGGGSVFFSSAADSPCVDFIVMCSVMFLLLAAQNHEFEMVSHIMFSGKSYGAKLGKISKDKSASKRRLFSSTYLGN